MLAQLKKIKEEALARITAVASEAKLRALEVELLGRKSALTNLLRGLKDLPAAEKNEAGTTANEVKKNIEAALAQKQNELQQAHYADLARTEWIDPTAPGTPALRGTLHPITQFLREAELVFTGLGFTIASGPEVEDDWHCLTALNIPADHPARDAQDTLFLEGTDLLLRTQTSSVQIRYAEKNPPPIRIIAPGKVFRKDDFDATHSPVFHQLEGLVIDRGIALTHMKAVISEALRQLINPKAKFRFRTSYFPFVEPGLEVDISCTVCGGSGCSACKGVGWLEVLGCGMVHPQVLENVKIDPKEFSGFAFGFGIDRMVMLKHKITDIRLLYENDLRFLRQF